jgi:hypothetical protein
MSSAIRTALIGLAAAGAFVKRMDHAVVLSADMEATRTVWATGVGAGIPPASGVTAPCVAPSSPRSEAMSESQLEASRPHYDPRIIFHRFDG